MTPAGYMAKAARALASAELLLTNGDLDGACNRAYYAMFDAAHAALLRSGAHVNPAETRTHRGLIAAFGEYLIKPGILPADLGKSLNQRAHPAARGLHGRGDRRGQDPLGRRAGRVIR